ncbi:MAG: hypothetical protein ACOC5G_04060 [Acidobacteriota bacterium]
MSLRDDQIEVQKGFIKHFKTKFTFPSRLTEIYDSYDFDIGRFNDWMEKTHGYDIKRHGSLSDFVKKNFGKEAVDFILGLIRTYPKIEVGLTIEQEVKKMIRRRDEKGAE